MDLSDPLRSLIPSLDSAALAVLAGTESALSASQVTLCATPPIWGRNVFVNIAMFISHVSIPKMGGKQRCRAARADNL